MALRSLKRAAPVAAGAVAVGACANYLASEEHRAAVAAKLAAARMALTPTVHASEIALTLLPPPASPKYKMCIIGFQAPAPDGRHA